MVIRPIWLNVSVILLTSLDNNWCMSWWRHQMETFSALLAICAGNSPVHGEFPAQRPVTRSFDVFFDLRLNKRLSKQPWGWWFETPAWSLWRHRNGVMLCRTHLRYMHLDSAVFLRRGAIYIHVHVIIHVIKKHWIALCRISSLNVTQIS